MGDFQEERSVAGYHAEPPYPQNDILYLYEQTVAVDRSIRKSKEGFEY